MNPFSKRTSWIIWFALMMFYLYMGGVVMSDASERIEAAATDARCAKPLDLNIMGITSRTAYQSLECMGIQGRSIYRQVEMRHDRVYPFAYGILLLFTLFALASFCTKNKLIVLVVSSLPLVIIVADFFENHFIVKLISGFPQVSADTIASLSFFNGAKWLLFFMAAFLILFFLTWSLVKLQRKKGNVS